VVVLFGLVVTSDRVYRGEKEDRVTPLVRERLEAAGHELVYSTIAPNDAEAIRRGVEEACQAAEIVLVTGGTGISPRDISVDVVASMAYRRIPGFGEAHRRASWEEVGERAMLSRADAFIVRTNGSKPCFVAVSPGSPSAVGLALTLILPVAQHIVDQLSGKPHP